MLAFKTAKECTRAIRQLPNSPQSFQHIQQTWEYIKQQKFTLDAYDYTHLLKQCYTPTHILLGSDILQHIQCNLPRNKIDNVLQTVMVNMLVKCGNPGKAVELWDDNLPADGIMYNSFVMACTKSGR